MENRVSMLGGGITRCHHGNCMWKIMVESNMQR